VDRDLTDIVHHDRALSLYNAIYTDGITRDFSSCRKSNKADLSHNNSATKDHIILPWLTLKFVSLIGSDSMTSLPQIKGIHVLMMYSDVYLGAAMLVILLALYRANTQTKILP
jgi:hypothetical protein